MALDFFGGVPAPEASAAASFGLSFLMGSGMTWCWTLVYGDDRAAWVESVDPAESLLPRHEQLIVDGGQGHFVAVECDGVALDDVDALE